MSEMRVTLLSWSGPLQILLPLALNKNRELIHHQILLAGQLTLRPISCSTLRHGDMFTQTFYQLHTI